MTIYKAPEHPIRHVVGRRPWVFLAGSIEMGKAEHWQPVAARLLDSAGFDVFDPRRDDWDSSWRQDVNEPAFVEQVSWEQRYLLGSEYALFHFEPGTMSPIALLELGQRSLLNRWTVVHCPDGFWRKGNVDIIVMNHDKMVPVKSIEDGIIWLAERSE